MTGYICCCLAPSEDEVKSKSSCCFSAGREGGWEFEERDDKVVEMELSKGLDEVGVTGLVGRLEP